MLRLLLALFLLIPMPVLADHVPTQPVYGQDLTTDNTAGTITIGILSSDGFEDSPPENYTIFFSGSSGITETNSFCVTTSFGHQTNTWQYYTFSNDDLKYYFADLSGKNFYFAIRSNNETDNSVSTLTTESVYNIYAGLPFEFNQTDWSAPTETNACNPYVVTTTTTTTTTSSTTTTTTTTTVPPKPEPEPEPEPEPYIPPPPPPPKPEEIIVDVKVEGVDKTYTQADVNDGTIERDQERVDNETKFGCFMTNAQIERGDCNIPELVEEDIKDDIIEEDVVIKEDIVEDTKDVEVIISEDDVTVLNPPKEEVFEDETVEFEELPIEFEIIEFDLEDIVPKDVVEIPIQDEIIEEIVDEKIDEKVLDEPIQEDVNEDIVREIPTEQGLEPIELTEEEVAIEVEQVKEIVENIVIEEVTVEEVVEVLEQVNDIGVQNLNQATEEVQEVIQAVVEEAIADVKELTEEQVEVVAEVLQVATEDVAIIAKSVKDDEVIAEAVEEYVERAVENADVENYTLADVVTEVQFETFIDNPIQTFIDIDIQEINFNDIGNDMTTDQKEKAQEVVVPVILTRIATMAAFIFRRSL